MPINQLLKIRVPYLFLIIFWILACFLAFAGLGDLPLRDFDEGTVARVSFELSQKEGIDKLLPTLWGINYLNKPPGIHWLIAKAIQALNQNLIGSNQLPSEFSIRFAPAFVSTFVVPLGGLIQVYLRPKDPIASISTAGILLTLLPLVRHGRLAMLDGPMLTAIALFWLLLVSLDGSFFDKWRIFGVGIASSAMLLIKAPLILPVLFAASLPIVIEAKNSKLFNIKSIFYYSVGLLPGISWHFWHAIQRGLGASWLWWGDGAGRVLFQPGSGSDLGWRVPLIEMAEGGWPWLLLLPIGLIWAWHERNTKWGLWSLSFYFVFAVSIFPLKTQLPWYSHPLWLPMSVLCGRPFSWLITRFNSERLPGRNLLSLLPVLLIALGSLLISLAVLGKTDIFQFFRPYSTIAICAGLGWLLGGSFLLSQFTNKRFLGLLIIISGSFFALICLMRSPMWLWELNEHWPVKPVAELVSKAKGDIVALDSSFERPSLNWYARQRIMTLEDQPEASWIITQNVNNFQLLDTARECKTFDKYQEWSLIFCEPNP